MHRAVQRSARREAGVLFFARRWSLRTGAALNGSRRESLVCSHSETVNVRCCALLVYSCCRTTWASSYSIGRMSVLPQSEAIRAIRLSDRWIDSRVPRILRLDRSHASDIWRELARARASESIVARRVSACPILIWTACILKLSAGADHKRTRFSPWVLRKLRQPDRSRRERGVDQPLSFSWKRL